MTLTAPKLDSRTFDSLMEEARARIPRFTPEWTNFNRSDPGMALVELQAWMTETILFELNRVPDLNYVKFLDLLGIVPEPAHPARTELSFTLDRLDKPDDDLVVPIPKVTKVSVDDPDIKQEITFETDRSLVALNADFGMVVAPKARDNLTRTIVTRYEKSAIWLHSFDPFDSPAVVGNCLYIGLVLRPNLNKPLASYLTDALPAGSLDLYADMAGVLDKDAQDQIITGPQTFGCAAAGAVGPQVEWQVFTGDQTQTNFTDGSDAGWTKLSLSSDETRGLVVSGHLVLELPAKATAVDPRSLRAEFWDSFGQLKPPANFAELVAILEDLEDVTALGDVWVKMGLTDATVLNDIAACGTSAAQVGTKLATLPAGVAPPDPAKLTVTDWIAVDPAFEAPIPMVEDRFRPLYWIRAKYRAPQAVGLPGVQTLRQLRLNTVSATQGATRLEDRLGVSNGRPGQVFTLPKIPVLIDPATGEPDLSLVVGGDPDWQRVDDFFASEPDDRHYKLDPGAGRISFGDGLRGQVPVANETVIVARMRTGGGAIGNVGPGTISKIKGTLRGVKSATNFRAAHDGSDAETLDAVKLRAPHELRHRDRAVSAEDFSDLALRTPGLALHKAVALSRKAVSNKAIVDREGAVTVILLPKTDAAQPQPTEDQLAAVCAWLEPRRLITTELHLTGPKYATVTRLSLRVLVRDDHDIPAVSEAIYQAILGFLHPITGGPEGGGWPFGEPIYHADLYERVLAVDGVRRAGSLAIDIDGGTMNLATDMTSLPEGALPALVRDRIDLVALYA